MPGFIKVNDADGVELIPTANLAIGRSVNKQTSSTAPVVEIVSTVMYGGPQAMA